MSQDIIKKFGADPFVLFDQWFSDAQDNEINDPNAMYLSTVNADGTPSLRTVLLKAHDTNGFVFYTNQGSTKGKALAANPHAEILFHWKTLQKQIRIHGAVEMVSDEQADAYFKSRHRESRIGAWASKQSQAMEHEDALKEREAMYRKQYAGQEDIPRPAHWSGYRVVPQHIEFWIAGEFRLHTRFIYTKNTQGWDVSWIYP